MKMYSASPTRKKSKRGASTMTKVCRTCLLDNKSNTSVFTLDISLNINFCDIVTSVTGLQISRNDGFTEYICSVCKHNSKAAYLYKIQAQQTDEKLRSTTSIQDNTEATEMRIVFSRLDDLLTDEKENEMTVKKELSDDEHNDYCSDDIFDENEASALYESVESVENEFKEEVEEMEEPLALHQCEVCERKFESKSSLYSHLETCIKVENDNEKLKWSSVCEDIDTKIQLEQHARSHDHLMTNDDDSQESAQSLEVSRSTHMNTQRVKKKELSSKSLRQHKSKCDATSSTTPRQHNPNKHILLCCFCNKGFRKESSLAQHKMDVCVPQYVCDICHCRLRSKYSLRKHLELHSVDNVKDPRKFPCTECKRVYSIESKLTVHILRHHRGEKPYKCTYCSKGFEKPRCLRVHTRVHTGEKSYPCNVCGRKFARTSTLGKHMRTHTGERPYKCSYCAQAFKYKHDAVRHEQNHTRAGDHPCPACGVKFAQANSLQIHKGMCAAISSRKRELCSICNKWCKRMHVLTHQPWRDFLCTECGLSFTTITHLTLHIRRKHTGEKPYKCKYCVKEFARSCTLGVHMRTHTGEKPYKCSYCERAFSQSQDAAKHERSHTGAAAHACTACGANFTKAKGLREHKTACDAKKSTTSCPSNSVATIPI